ncbi:MAG TPA: Ig-like domain-containing protein [Bryobacteraceae bacterium]
MKVLSIVPELVEKSGNWRKHPAVTNLWKAALLLTLLVPSGQGETRVRFQPSSPTVGPFPANVLTVPDSRQKTGLRIDLPASFGACDPGTSPSVCSNTDLLNQLDGFSVNPRITVCFSDAIDTSTLAAGISLVPAGKRAPVIALNQIFYAPGKHCAFAKPDHVLKEQSDYLLLVSDAVHDASGNAVAPAPAFTACLQDKPDDYCAELSAAIKGSAPPRSHIAGASLFTTLSTTPWMEHAKHFVDTHQPSVVLPAGTPSTFNLSTIREIKWNPQGSGFPPQSIPIEVLDGVKSISFGLYLSPNFLNPLNGTIPTTPTGKGIADAIAPIPLPLPVPNVALGYAPVSFHVFLPAGPAPHPGFPVVIYGHGLGDNQFGAPTFIAGTLARKGFATLAIEITGHGYGPLSTVKLTDSNGIIHTVSTPGRGILIPGNSQIGPADGCVVPGAIAVRDCGRQTAVDLFALTRTIQETKGLGLHLDPKRIYYVGQSFGADYGTLLQALEPSIGAAVLSGAGGSLVDVARLSISGRPLAIGYLTSVSPALLNAKAGSDFNDNYPFRDRPPVVNQVSGAPAIQAAFEAADWLNMPGDPLAYAPRLKGADKPGGNTLFQFGFGDLEMPDPTQSAVIRAADARLASWFFRFDAAAQIDPPLLGLTYPGVGFPILPHRILSNPTIFDVPAETSVSLAAQQQAAEYFSSRGKSNPDPNPYLTGIFAGTKLFHIPAHLPESLNFLVPVPE